MKVIGSAIDRWAGVVNSAASAALPQSGCIILPTYKWFGAVIQNMLKLGVAIQNILKLGIVIQNILKRVTVR